MDRYKYKKTYHLPFTQTVTSDDKMIDIKAFSDRIKGREIVITEKMDGENTTLYSDGYVHARSIDSTSHPSRSWVKQYWGSRCRHLPENWRVCGENLFARHSIEYNKLPSYFMAFSIFDENNMRLPWNDFVDWCVALGILTVPVLYRGICDDNWLELAKSKYERIVNNCGGEGIVLTVTDTFHYDEHSLWMAKAVRADHVQTDDHWMNKAVVPNKLMDGAHRI